MPIIVTIVVAVLLVVAMICGTVIWMMQRTMTLSEKYIDARLAEVRSETAPPQVQPPTPVPAAAVTSGTMPTVLPPATAVPEAPKATHRPKPTPMPKTTPQAPKTTAKPATPPAEVKPATPDSAKPAPTAMTTPAPQKRQPPVELPTSKERLGPDGLPMDRIILPVGSDEVDWQL